MEGVYTGECPAPKNSALFTALVLRGFGSEDY